MLILALSLSLSLSQEILERMAGYLKERSSPKIMMFFSAGAAVVYGILPKVNLLQNPTIVLRRWINVKQKK
jgi:hypothetical protein